MCRIKLRRLDFNFGSDFSFRHRHRLDDSRRKFIDGQAKSGKIFVRLEHNQFFWGFGAILCKPFVDLASSPESIFLPTFFLCFAFLLFSGAFLVSNFDEDFNQNEDSTDFVKPIWTTGTAWLITIFNFVHIGVESSVGGWITTYESRLALTATGGWLSAAVVYFSFLVVGRAVAPLFFRFLGDNAVLFCSLAIMTTGIVLILLTESFSFLMIGAATLGLELLQFSRLICRVLHKIFGLRATENAAPLSSLEVSAAHSRLGSSVSHRRLRAACAQDFSYINKLRFINCFTNHPGRS
jgi:hypothetical protein